MVTRTRAHDSQRGPSGRAPQKLRDGAPRRSPCGRLPRSSRALSVPSLDIAGEAGTRREVRRPVASPRRPPRRRCGRPGETARASGFLSCRAKRSGESLSRAVEAPRYRPRAGTRDRRCGVAALLWVGAPESRAERPRRGRSRPDGRVDRGTRATGRGAGRLRRRPRRCGITVGVGDRSTETSGDGNDGRARTVAHGYRTRRRAAVDLPGGIVDDGRRDGWLWRGDRGPRRVSGNSSETRRPPRTKRTRRGKKNFFPRRIARTDSRPPNRVFPR